MSCTGLRVGNTSRTMLSFEKMERSITNTFTASLIRTSIVLRLHVRE